MTVESTAQQLINAGVEPGLAQVAAVDLSFGETGATSENLAQAYEQIQSGAYLDQRSDKMAELFSRADEIGSKYQ